METKKSFCRFCHASCGIEVDVEENRVLAVRGDPDNVVSQGYTCIKGRAELERIYHPDRLLGPGSLRTAVEARSRPSRPWTKSAAKVKEIIDEYGPQFRCRIRWVWRVPQLCLRPLVRLEIHRGPRFSKHVHLLHR